MKKAPRLPMLLTALALPAAAFGCGDAGGPDVTGFWVWSAQVENDETILEITDEDMKVIVGPDGWPDCPPGIMCTHYGIRKLRFDPRGDVHFMYNVHTSSDYQYPGSYSVEGNLVRFEFDEKFSCAHPDQSDEDRRSAYAKVKTVGGDLWVSVEDLTPGLRFFSDPPAEEPSRWIVFRRITEEEYETRYMIRVCVAASDDDCHPDCFPERYGYTH